MKKGYGTGLIYETGLALNLDAKFYFGFGLIFCQVSQGVAQLYIAVSRAKLLVYSEEGKARGLVVRD